MSRIYRYTLSVPKLQEKRREGLLVCLQLESGEERWADIAPLPNWSQETLEQALAQLKVVLPQLAQGQEQEQEQRPLDLYPSVSFGLESALCLQSATAPSSVPLAGFLMGSRAEILKKGKHLIELGYKTAKIKIASLPLDDALFVFNALKDSLYLRIDLNRAWPRAKTEHFFSHFPKDCFDYIEEPTDNLEDLYTFPYPLALDESLPLIPLEKLAKIAHLKAIVIKPTLHGAFSRWAHLAQFAREKNIDLVLGGAYESGVGIAQIARLIEQHKLPPVPLGIDTYSYIEQDLLETPLDFSGAELILPDVLKIRMNGLILVS